MTGDPRVMENPELTAVTTLFMREHNYWVATLKAQNPDWTGDQLYNMARAITTAEYQNIIYNEYLPLLLGSVPAHAGYDPHTNAQVTQEFSTAAFRIGHSEVSDTQEGLDNNGNQVFVEPLAQAFFNTPEQDFANGINPLLRSLSSALASDPVLQQDLQTTYGSIDNVDLFIGGLAEPHVGNARVGQTFQAIISRQFQNLRTGDRFFWQNQPFDPHTASMISSATLATILRRDTDSTNVPDRVFIPTAPAARVKPAAATAPTSSINTSGRPFIFP